MEGIFAEVPAIGIDVIMIIVELRALIEVLDASCSAKGRLLQLDTAWLQRRRIAPSTWNLPFRAIRFCRELHFRLHLEKIDTPVENYRQFYPNAYIELISSPSYCSPACSPAGGAPGMVMSRVVTLPNVESGRSNSLELPTTRTANLLRSTYLFATRVTSASVTFSRAARERSTK